MARKPKPEPEPEPEPVEKPEPEPELPVATVGEKFKVEYKPTPEIDGIKNELPIVPEKLVYHRPQKPTMTDHEGRAFRNWLTEYMAWAQHPDKVL